MKRLIQSLIERRAAIWFGSILVVMVLLAVDIFAALVDHNFIQAIIVGVVFCIVIYTIISEAFK